MAEGFRVRDPVHNFLQLREKEAELLGTRLLQRLRGIRQLALASLVYPGALHTRFDHSLGVCHVAGMMAEQLGLPDDEVQLVRQAALLHDLGHGPLSHVSENVLKRYAKPDTIPEDQKKETIHELITAYLIANDPQIVDILGKQTCTRIAKLLSAGHGQPALRSIVSGPLDADKQDYLLRDSLFCGVQYGVFDIHQFHRSLTLHGVEDEKELMIIPDGIHAVEQYVLAKYYLTTNVYRHRVRLITDQMIVRGIVLGIEEDGMDDLMRVYAFDNSDAFMQQYIEWDDGRLLHSFDDRARPNTLCGQFLSRLQTRQLHKQVYSQRVDQLARGEPETREKLVAIGKMENEELRKRLETEIASILARHGCGSIDPRWIIVHGFDIQSVRTSSRNDEASIMVVRANGPRPFEQDSSLFASISEGYAEAYVEVYAPVTWDTRADRQKLRSALERPITECVENMCK
jgi:HD superfamily phosphohydrolase